MAPKASHGVVIEEIDDDRSDRKESNGSTPKPDIQPEVSRPSQEPASGGDEGASGSASEGASTAVEAVSAETASKELTEREKEKLAEAEKLKADGNKLYADGQFQEALEKYSEALALATEKAAQQRAVYFANSAAVHLKLQQFAEAAKDASAALDLEPSTSLRIKALTRRSNAYEKLDDLDRALMDMEKVVELDGTNTAAVSTVKQLKPIVEERREKMKNEMIDKLKELGNSLLGKFGMSLDNFKAEKDPTTGSYSINFQQ